MRSLTESFIKEGLPLIQREGVSLLIMENPEEGLDKVRDILYQAVDGKTSLFLSGGSTPEPLYKKLAEEKELKAGAVGMVDERFGEPFHPRSNEAMMQSTGLLAYLETQNTRFYPVLQAGKNQEEVTLDYDQTARSLLLNFPRSVAVLGIGDDGHTAGIAPDRKDFQNPIFKETEKHLFVSGFDDPTGSFKERVTLTFEALERMDVLLILTFGEKKKEALQKMFLAGPIEEIPSRFYLRPNIAPKTLLITDQKI